MNTSNVNSLWGSIIAQELAQLSVGPVCLSPGSRNTPLTVALSEQENLTVLSHLDERSSAFFALGYGRRTGQPSVVVSSSGTATAEFHPAVLEAGADRVPLLVLTADRPPELQESGANQTINQSELYGKATRWCRDLPEPETNDRKIRSLRTNVDRAVHRTKGSNPGPVHLNVPFRKPLEPGEQPDDSVLEFTNSNPLASEGREHRPYTTFHAGRGIASPRGKDYFRSLLGEANRPAIYLGPIPSHRQGETHRIRDFAKESGVPLLADPLSGQRHTSDGDWKPLLAYEFFLPELRELSLDEPDLILRLGHAPNASNHFMDYLEETEAQQILVHAGAEYHDAQFNVTEVFQVPPAKLLADLDPSVASVDTQWTQALTDLDECLRESLTVELSDKPNPFEADVLREVLDGLRSGDTLLVGNSTPVRDLIQYCGYHDEDLLLAANRGTSGIDGQISTAAGYGFTGEGQAVAVLGDVSFYHDLTGLIHFDRQDISGVIVVINNDGGGIFQRLPIKDVDPPFTEFVRAPHGLTFEGAATQFHADYTRVEDLETFRTEFNRGLDQSELTIIEITTNPEQNQRYREQLQDQLRKTTHEWSARQ